MMSYFCPSLLMRFVAADNIRIIGRDYLLPPYDYLEIKIIDF